MANQVVGNKYTWVIKDFSSLQSKFICSDTFVIDGCKWHLRAYPKGDSGVDSSLSLYLEVANFKTLPSGWRRLTKASLTVVNHLSEKLSLRREIHDWLDEKSTGWGHSPMVKHSILYAKDGGFLVNNEVKIVTEVEVLEVIGGLDVTEESVELTRPPKKVRRDLHQETIDINGFQVLPSQVEFVRRIFEKQPDIALGVLSKNRYLRTALMHIVISLIETLQKPLQGLSYDDLMEANSALVYVKDLGFKVDWLEKKLEEVKEKKKEAQICESRVQELDKALKECKRKWSEIETQLEKEKAKLLASRAHLAWDDFA